MGVEWGMHYVQILDREISVTSSEMCRLSFYFCIEREAWHITSLVVRIAATTDSARGSHRASGTSFERLMPRRAGVVSSRLAASHLMTTISSARAVERFVVFRDSGSCLRFQFPRLQCPSIIGVLTLSLDPSPPLELPLCHPYD